MKHIERSFWESLRRFFEPIKKEWKQYFHLWIHDATVSFLSVMIIYCIQYLVQAIEEWNFEKFYFRTYILVWIAIANFFIMIMRKPIVFKVFSDFRSRVDSICLPLLIYGDNNTYDKIGTWRLQWIYVKWTLSWERIATDLFWWWAGSLVLFMAFMITVYQKSTSMFFAALWTLILIIVRFYFTWWKQYPPRRLAKLEWIKMARIQTRRFMNKFEILQQDKVDDELSKRFEVNDKRYWFVKKEKFYQWISFDGSMMFATLLFIALIFFTGKQVLEWTLLYSDLVVIVWLWSAFIKDLDWILKKIRRSIVDKWIDIEQLRDLLDSLETDMDLHSWPNFNYSGWDIQLINLDYAYDSQTIFKDFSLTIDWWSTTAFVWLSWSWKTTLIKLIAWYLSPLSGTVVVDGQDISKTSLNSYYKHIGYLTQDPSVFDGTVRENLTYAVDKEISSQGTQMREKVDEAIKNSKCEFVYELKDWLQTEIGERGVRLSWGQRQRLAIAKIFLKDPEIIILDEPTSSLDSFSEEGITEAMHSLFEWRTVIIIAHRLQTVKQADDIILLDEWKIVERWTHDVLVEKWWQYAKMLELQSGF